MQVPFEIGSDFDVLQTQLHWWLAHLPESLRLTRATINQRKHASQLGALLLCHFTYHQTMCDLTRIGREERFAMRGGYQGPREQTAFLRAVQNQCFEHNMALCALFEEASRHGTQGFADSWLSVVAHDSARMITDHIAMGLGSSREKGEALRAHVVAAVHSNIRALESMIPLHALAQSLVSTSLVTHLSPRKLCVCACVRVCSDEDSG